MSLAETTNPASPPYFSDLHKAAMEYAQMGMPIFICNPNSKDPATGQGFKNATLDLDTINAWFQENPRWNIATEPERSGLAVIDVEATGLEDWNWLAGEYGPPIQTFTNRTPRGGIHLFFRGSLPTTTKRLKMDVDTRGRGGYVLLPPSVVNGVAYETIGDCPPADLPEWFESLIANITAKREAREAPAGTVYDQPLDLNKARSWLALQPVPVQGQRNDATYKAACTLKDFGCSPQTILDMLLKWAPLSDDFTEEEVEGRVISAFENGQNAPGCDSLEPTEKVFGKFVANVANTTPKTSVSRIITRKGSELKPRAIEWMWQDRFPRAMLSLLAGHGGLGKTTVLLDIAARITKGERWPDGVGAAKQGSVIYFSGEDSAEHTLLPRFLASKGDPERIYFVSAVKREDGEGNRTFDLKADLLELEKTIADFGDVELVIFDPISSYFGNADTWRSNQVRAVLEPVAEMADRRRVSIIGNTHFTKAGKGSANMRILDSVAMIAVARACYVVVEDAEDENQRLFLRSKNNLGPPKDGLTFTIGTTFIDVGITASFARWGDPVSGSADAALAASEDKARPRTAIDEAKDFLREQLANGPKLVDDVYGAAGEIKIAARTLKRARAELGIISDKEHTADGKFWIKLPAN